MCVGIWRKAKWIPSNSKKLNGEYSLFVTFDFDNKILGVIRGLPSKFWNPEEKVWEVPFNKLGYLVENLPDYDFDITGQYVCLEKPAGEVFFCK